MPGNEDRLGLESDPFDGIRLGWGTMERLIVFILAGRTDLRIVKVGKAWQFDSRNVHEQLASGSRRWRMQEERVPIINKWMTEDEIPSGQEELILYPDKTLWLAKSLENGRDRVAGVVVFNTCRRRDFQTDKGSGGDHGGKEPVALGPVLARWLGGKFSLEVAARANDIGFGKAGWVNYLDGEMDVYEPNSRHVNRLGLLRIEEAMRRFALPQTRALLFTGGGFPGFKEPVQELGRLLFDDRISFPLVPEGRAETEMESAAATAEDSYKARQHAIRHIRRGDFPAAHAAAAHLEGEPREAGWTAALKAAANFFSGEPVTSDCAPDSLRRLVTLESRHYFVSAALRAESALRSGHVVDALLATVSFFDAALLESVRRGLGMVVDTRISRPDMIFGHEKNDLIAELAKTLPHLLKKMNGGWQIQVSGKEKSGWCDWLQQRDSRYKPLQSINQIITGYPQSGISVNQFRNQAIHNRLSAEQARTVRQYLTDKELWGKTDDGCPFLDRPLVRATVALHTSADLADAYRSLEAELIGLLRNSPIQP